MPDLKTAIAPAFTLSTAETFELVFSSGTSPVTVTVPSGTYRMNLAPTTGSVTDYLRAVQTAMNTALSGRGETASVTIGTAGVCTIGIAGTGWTTANEVTGSPLRRLGFAASQSTGASQSITATRSVCYLATFIERISVGWQTKQVVSGSMTLTGVPYGIAAGITRAEDSIALGFLPRDPTFRASLGADQTALNPAGAYVTAIGTVAEREWSVLDVLRASVGQTVAFALGVWDTVSASTTDRFDVGSITIESVMSPNIERLRDGWDAYYRISLAIVRTSTGTRA